MRTQNDHTSLMAALRQEYAVRFPGARAAHERAQRVLVDGESHGARLYDPYPFRVARAEGAYVTDVDGNRIVDYWQGHYSNILGHNPELVRRALVASLEAGHGLQTGFPEDAQTEFAELLVRATGAERVRCTTAGTLATMYAIMLSRGYTGRPLVVKAAGGWHGAQPMALKGVSRAADGFEHVDSAGVSAATAEEIIVIPYNDVTRLEQVFQDQGARIACLIFEPCLGSAGFLPATRAFMETARRLTTVHGAVLVLDEIITGFRYCAAGMQRLYGVQADLTTLGKIVGGGMPLSVVLGRADIMDMAGAKATRRVWFNGGTFSAHPLTLRAATTTLRHLMAHEDEIYPALAAAGERLRRGIEGAFAAEGILARCTGHSEDAVAGSSLISVYFPRREGLVPTSADDMLDPALYDVELREKVLKLGMLLEGVNVVHGLGAVSVSHSRVEIDRTVEAFSAFARRVRQA